MSAAGVDASGVTEGKEVSLARGVEAVFERINGTYFDSESSTGKLDRRAVKSRVDGLVSMVKGLKIDDIKLRASLAARDEELKELEKELRIERQRLNYVDSENKLLNKFLEENYALMDEEAKDRYIAERRARQAEAEARQAEAENAELDETIGLLSLEAQRGKKFLTFARILEGGEVADRVRVLTGWTSAETFVNSWELVNYDGMAEEMVMYGDDHRPEPEERQRTFSRRPKRKVFVWADIYFYWWFVVKTGLDQTVASMLFGIEYQTAARAFVSMTCYQHKFWKFMFTQPTLAEVQKCAPPDFTEVYGTDRLTRIFDATEIPIETPSDRSAQALTFSKYKSHNTVKLLGAITPGGAAVFSSDAYPGRVTDDKLTRACGFVGTMGPGEAAAADKGFLSSKPLFAAEGKELRMPAVRNRTLTGDQVADSSAQSNLRIHIERAFAGPKSYRMLGGEIRITQVDLVGMIFSTVFFCHVNFHRPLTGSIDTVADED